MISTTIRPGELYRVKTIYRGQRLQRDIVAETADAAIDKLITQLDQPR